MQLHELQVKIGRRGKRVGRGGKRGTYSGRGQKGQKSRAGRRIRPAARDLILRIPKRRGFSHRPLKPKPIVINLARIAALKTLEANPVIDTEFLKRAGLVPLRYRGVVKLLGEGEILRPVTVRGISASKSAAIKIERAGGRVIANNAKN